MRCIMLTLLLLMVGCAPKPPADVEPRQSRFGATLMRKVDGGYELANRRLRVVIDEKSGNATYLGSADGKRNLLADPGVVGVTARFDSQPPEGYVEKRDDQTWQYLGDSLGGIRWRKIYCLEFGSVFVTYLIENRTNQPIDTAIALRAKFKGGQIVTSQADLHEVKFDHARLRLQAFNEGKPQRPDWATLIGDSRTLQPNERIGITMEWKIDGL